MQLIKPPQSISTRSPLNQTLFLAGSIEEGRADDWQTDVCNYLENIERLTIFNPRRFEWDASWGDGLDNPVVSEQITWELDALSIADLVLFYFHPDTQAPITLMELGFITKYVEKNQTHVDVVCPERYWKRANVEMMCKRFDIPFFETLEQVLPLYYTGI